MSATIIVATAAIGTCPLHIFTFLTITSFMIRRTFSIRITLRYSWTRLIHIRTTFTIITLVVSTIPTFCSGCSALSGSSSCFSGCGGALSSGSSCFSGCGGALSSGSSCAYANTINAGLTSCATTCPFARTIVTSSTISRTYTGYITFSCGSSCRSSYYKNSK